MHFRFLSTTTLKSQALIFAALVPAVFFSPSIPKMSWTELVWPLYEPRAMNDISQHLSIGDARQNQLQRLATQSRDLVTTSRLLRGKQQAGKCRRRNPFLNPFLSPSSHMPHGQTSLEWSNHLFFFGPPPLSFCTHALAPVKMFLVWCNELHHAYPSE